MRGIECVAVLSKGSSWYADDGLPVCLKTVSVLNIVKSKVKSVEIRSFA